MQSTRTGCWSEPGILRNYTTGQVCSCNNSARSFLWAHTWLPLCWEHGSSGLNDKYQVFSCRLPPWFCQHVPIHNPCTRDPSSDEDARGRITENIHLQDTGHRTSTLWVSAAPYCPDFVSHLWPEPWCPTRLSRDTLFRKIKDFTL